MGSIDAIRMTVTRGDSMIVDFVSHFIAATAWESNPTLQLRVAGSIFSHFLPDHLMRETSVDVIFKTQFNADIVYNLVAPLLVAVYPGCMVRCVSTAGAKVHPPSLPTSVSVSAVDATSNAMAP